MNRRNFLKYLGVGTIASFFAKLTPSTWAATKHETYSLGFIDLTEEPPVFYPPRDVESAKRYIEVDRQIFSSKMIREEITNFGLAPIKTAGASLVIDVPFYNHYHICSQKYHDYEPSKISFSENEAWICFWKDYVKQGPYEGDKIFWRRIPTIVKFKAIDHGRTLYSVDARFSTNA